MFEDSVVLLETNEANDVGDEMAAKERTDWLMSMMEYRGEIYEYLRKSEVR